MKKLYILFVVVVVALQVRADFPFGYRYLRNWKISDMLATVDSIPVDTAHVNFQDANPIDRFSIANSYNGNLGSPIQSKLYFNRPEQGEFIFADAYFPYIKTAYNTTFYNTKTPFTTIKYNSGGTNYREEEQVDFTFTANFKKNFNMGVNFDYIYARGEYNNQAAKRFAGTLFGSYNGKHYAATGALISNNHSNHENGGITDDDYITNPPLGIIPSNIPTNTAGYSNFRHDQFLYNHQYNIGIDRVVKVKDDSIGTEYVPVTRFSHTFLFDRYRKRFYERSVDSNFYQNTYFPELTQTNDTAALTMYSNRLAISLEEEFNKWMQFGLTAYIQNDIETFTYMRDTFLTKEVTSDVMIGGVLSRNLGRRFKYNFAGQMYVLGDKLGDFSLDGKMGGYFTLWNDSVALVAKGFIKSHEPWFFTQFYHSKHFRWENNFGKVYRTQLGGKFALPTRDLELEVQVENLTNTIYFDSQALPSQYSGNIQVLAADLKKNFRFRKFHLENNLVYQASSHQDILPLPALTLFHNLYYLDKWFDVLSMQIGANVRYHTAYYAPKYMPATGQFYVQSDKKIGNYPVMNAYVNAHLKRTRFFLEYYHFNELFMRGAYFSMPGYPIFPAMFKVGLSWNFYD